MRLVLALPAVAFVAATTMSCIGDDDGDPSNYVVVTMIEQAYKDASCTYLTNCGYFPDKASCIAAAPIASVSGSVPIDLDPNVVAAVSAGRVYYHGSNVKACFDALAARACDSTSESARVTPPECRNILSGTVHGGELCTIDEECISGSCSSSNGTSCSMGTCIGDVAPVFEPAQVGENCSGQASCVSGAYCDQVNGMCAVLKTSGATCTQNYECDYGLGCAGTTGARTCTTLPTAGQTCGLSDKPCRDVGTQCVYDSLTAMYSCKQVALEGQTCSSTTPCSPWYPCNSTSLTCTKGPSVGMTCGFSTPCFDADTFCDTTTSMCTALKSDGMACTSNTQCASDFCDTTQTAPLCAAPMVCF